MDYLQADKNGLSIFIDIVGRRACFCAVLFYIALRFLASSEVSEENFVSFT